MGTRLGTTSADDGHETVARQRSDGARPPADVAGSTGEGGVTITAALAGTVARHLRLVASRGESPPREILDAIDVLESARVTAAPPGLVLERRPGQPDRVRVPVESTGWVAMALTESFAASSRVNGVRPAPDLVALRDGLRRARLVADLSKGSASGTPQQSEAHDPTVSFLSTAQYAERRGCSSARVRQLCRAGRLAGAHRVGRDWSIPATATIVPPSQKEP
jgi:hypothetical protein